MTKTVKKLPTQAEMGKWWGLANVSKKYSVPATNIARAAKQKLGNHIRVRSRILSGGEGPVVFFEPDVKEYAKTYKHSRQNRMSKLCDLRSLVPKGRICHYVSVNAKETGGGAICGANGEWSKAKQGKGLTICSRCSEKSSKYVLRGRK